MTHVLQFFAMAVSASLLDLRSPQPHFENHPFLTAAAAEYLRNEGARLVGIDSYNMDDTADGHRPVHTVLLRAGIPIIEHLRGTAVPPKLSGIGTFPVRAFATLAGTTAARE